MTQVVSFARATLFASLSLALASACGGQSFTGNGGEGGDAGAGQGGTTSRAGSTGTAGKAQAGSSSSGGSVIIGGSGPIGGTGVGGSGGSFSEECSAPPESGQCNAYMPSWYHDPSTGICLPFVYGGCGGNGNRYPSLEACQKSCPGGNPNFDACKAPSDCFITGTGCCGICDSPNITAHDLISYNVAYANQLQCGVALDIASGGNSSGAAAPIACEPCAAPLPGQGTLKYFVPGCQANECIIEDLRTSPVTACKTSDECKVRAGTACCESCNGGDLIGVRNDGSFEKLVCGTGPVGCLACLPQPTGAVPYCSPLGRCEVAYAVEAGAK